MITARLVRGPLGGRALDVPDGWTGDWLRLDPGPQLWGFYRVTHRCGGVVLAEVVATAPVVRG
ncbi:hypothetical protein QC334_34395 [Streptomyces sp. DH18]|uniref:hypothetical protein n=1 Tax=Streptomyces sp. DH18 TaxID=3040126 RepID=UPI0024425E54|nr:hypothetical protein [Streptomyces sp. DH18]MDG9687760.1 hypothetical protein [Streptomyces sp. DH18]